MFNKELKIFLAVVFFLFAFVAVTSSWLIRAVEADARAVAQDSLPGLVNAGGALTQMQENWLRLNQLLAAAEAAERKELIARIRTHSTDDYWKGYSEAIFALDDRDLFNRLQNSRARFLQQRERFFTLVEAGELVSARQHYEATLKFDFEKYAAAAKALFNLNVSEGQQHARRILHLSRWTPFCLAVFSVVLFLAGAFVGFKASLGAFSGAWRSPE